MTTFHLYFCRLYKNKVQEMPGWNDEVLGWCLQEACERKLKKQDYWGGFVIDKMKIQVSTDYIHMGIHPPERMIIWGI